MKVKLYHHCAIYRLLFRWEWNDRRAIRQRARLKLRTLKLLNIIQSKLEEEATDAIKEQNGANLLEIADDYSRLQYVKENYKEIL